jgi:hypothetical protein
VRTDVLTDVNSFDDIDASDGYVDHDDLGDLDDHLLDLISNTMGAATSSVSRILLFLLSSL